MKTIVHAAKNFPRTFSNPLARAALPLFFALAFLPAVLCLSLPGFSVTTPVAAGGPVLAAFWLAGSLRGLPVNSVALGIIVTALFWSANWIMMAGDQCCATLMGVH